MVWMPPAYCMPGLPLGLPGSPKGGPGKPVPGCGQGQAYQACPGLDPGSGMTIVGLFAKPLKLNEEYISMPSLTIALFFANALSSANNGRHAEYTANLGTS
jgi:hypothetical protein